MQEQDFAQRIELVGKSWDKLKGLRQEAEVLLDAQTFAAFQSLYTVCNDAFTQVWAARQVGDDRGLAMATQSAMMALDKASELRAKVVLAIQKAIAT